MAIYEQEIKQVNFLCETGTAINPGDMLIVSSGTVSPVSTVTAATLATAQASVSATFAGCSLDKRLAAQDRPEDLAVATAGRDTKKIVPVNSTYYPGQLFGPATNGNTSAPYLLSDTLVAVSASSLATHVLVETALPYASVVSAGLINTVTRGV